MWILYQIVFATGLLLAAFFLLVRRGRHYLPTLAGRLGGHRGRPVRRALWIHAVSVGEVGVAATLAEALPEEVPLLVTTVTPTGQQRAEKLFGQRAAVAYLPFDLGLPVRRFLRRFEPRALILVEGDYWPLLLHHAGRRGLPVAVINGRVGDASFRRMRRLAAAGPLGRLLRALFDPVERFGVQGGGDRERLLALGVPGERITVTGNLKYETPDPPRHPVLEGHLEEVAGGRAVLVAGSTMEGEEELVARAFRELDGSRALLVVAPRHPERWGEVAALLRERGLAVLRRSRLAERPDRGGAVDVVLLDSLGELAGLYAVATAAFIGGTLVSTGGHNPLEPARFAVPTAAGPSMENFRDIAGSFDGAGAWERVADPAGLAAAWRRWLDDPEARRRVGERAGRLVEDNRGSVAETLAMLEPIVERLR